MLNFNQKADNMLQEFSASGIGISVEGNNLKIESVKPLTNNQRNLIRKLKSEFLKYLRDQNKVEEHCSRVEVVAEKATFQKEGLKPDKKGEQKETTPDSYLGMSTNQIIPTQRLKFYWSVLGDCIEDRIKFTFRCTDQHEANELKILTFSLVYQINDRWKVELNGMELRAEPPAGKEGGVVKKLEYSCLEKTTELRKCV